MAESEVVQAIFNLAAIQAATATVVVLREVMQGPWQVQIQPAQGRHTHREMADQL